MTRLTLIIATLLLAFSVGTFAQSVSNDAISQRIRSARAEKNITLSFDADAKTSKLMAVSDNFSRSEAGRAGILAMNFAIGFHYRGDALSKSPDSFLLTFWVLTKKPRFAASHDMTAELSDEMLVIGSARYAARARDEMEYLNFEVSRENLMKIAGRSEVKFKLGDEEFTFTRGQMKLFADLLAITEVGN